MSHIIHCDTLQLENHYTRGSVEIKHGFNNDLKFTSPTSFAEIKLGSYLLHIDKDGSLVIKKNGGVLLSINS